MDLIKKPKLQYVRECVHNHIHVLEMKSPAMGHIFQASALGDQLLEV